MSPMSFLTFAIRVLVLLLIATIAQADIRLPRLIDSGMVLQRDTPLTVWGWADAKEEVVITFQEQRYITTADSQGNWRMQLPALPAGGPYSMTLAGKNLIELNNILLGDVWLASGQSNMELNFTRTKPLYEDEINSAHYPNIRWFKVPNRYQFKHPEKDLDGGEWLSVTRETISELATVPYFFAKHLHQQQEVPIGIVHAALGGSPVEAWLSEEALQKFPVHLAEGKRFRDDALIEQITTADQARGDAWRAARDKQDPGFQEGEALWAQPEVDDSDWPLMTMPGFWDAKQPNGVWWLRKTITVPDDWAGQPAFLELGRMVDADMVYLNGERVGVTWYQYPPRWYPLPQGVLKAGENTIAIRLTSESGQPGLVKDRAYELRWQGEAINLAGEWRVKQGAALEPLQPQTFIRWKPMGLFNGKIAPLTLYALKGVIWYQGESNVGRAEEYTQLFSALIQDWRHQFSQPQLPFLFVQLPNYLQHKNQPGESDWARLREAQAEALTLPHTAMAVAIDLGEWNDIHPLNKKPVGDRLALAARAIAYGEELVYSGPRYRTLAIEDNEAHLHFDHNGSGLASCDGEPLAEFAIAGKDGKFVWADVRIVENKIIVSSDAITQPVAVRYAWADNPHRANLCNKEGLLASPFRSDNWPQ